MNPSNRTDRPKSNMSALQLLSRDPVSVGLQLEQNNDMDEEDLEIPANSIRILPPQVPNFVKMIEIYGKSLVQVNTSKTGAGKTMTAIALAMATNNNIMYVGPQTMVTRIERDTARFGVQSWVFGHDRIKSGNFEFLIKNDKVYRPSPVLTNAIKGIYWDPIQQRVVQTGRGLLIVVDEVHAFKNADTERSTALLAIIREVFRLNEEAIAVGTPFSSRILLLSATVGDKDTNSLALARLLGLTFQDSYYQLDHANKKKVIPTGILEVWQNLGRIERAFTGNDTVTKELSGFELKPGLSGPGTATNLLFQGITRILVPTIFSSISRINLPYNRYCYDFYAHIPTAEARADMRRAIRDMEQAVPARFIDDDNVDPGRVDIGAFGAAVQRIHTILAPTVVSLAINYMQVNPSSKVILYAFYHRDIDEMARLMAQYNPLVLTGKVTGGRTEIIDAFNAPNLNHRVLIANFRIGKEGISLDDTHGGFPRITIMLPSYYFIDMIQASGRTLRMTTKSDSTIYIVYSREEPDMLNFFKNFSSKGNKIKGFRAETDEEFDEDDETADDDRLPGEYDMFIEKAYPTEDISTIQEKIVKSREVGRQIALTV